MTLNRWFLLIAVFVAVGGQAEDEIPAAPSVDGTEAIITEGEPEPVVTATPDPLPDESSNDIPPVVEEEEKVQIAEPVPEVIPQVIQEFEVAQIPASERMIIGRFKVIKDGDDITNECRICLQYKPKSCLSLKERGLVVTTHRNGITNFQRMVCNEDSRNPERYFVRGAYFYVDSRQNVGTYFGNLTLDTTPQKGYKAGWAHVTQVEDQFDREVAPFHRAIGKAAQMRYIRSLPKLKTEQPKVEKVADKENDKAEEKAPDPMEGEARNAREKFYVSTSLFLPARSYGGQLSTASAGKTGGSRFGAELAGYLPYADFTTALGASLRYNKDSFDVLNTTTGLNTNISSTMLTIGASGRYYLNERIGDRLYLRGDLGLSKITFNNVSSSFGLGFLVGAGYDFPIKRHFRLGAFVNYTSDSANYKDPATSIEQSWSTSAVSFGVSALF